MVRLKANLNFNVLIKTREFQFQNGAIKRGNVTASLHDFVQFQFQNGAIKRFCSQKWVFSNKRFQFQNGAIKRCFLDKGNPCALISIPKWCD